MTATFVNTKKGLFYFIDIDIDMIELIQTSLAYGFMAALKLNTIKDIQSLSDDELIEEAKDFVNKVSIQLGNTKKFIN